MRNFISKYIRKILLWLISIIVIVFVVLVVCFAVIHISTESYIYEEVSSLPHTQAAMILGAAVYADGSLSPALKDRVETAMQIYRSGKVDKILVTGANPTVDYNEVNPIRKYLLKNNIPDKDIFLDHAGFDTYSSMYRARDIFLVKSMIVVTQTFHLSRSIYIAHSLGLNAVGMSADKGHYRLYNYFREIFADVKAFGDLVFDRQPQYLGSTIPITGDGTLNP